MGALLAVLLAFPTALMYHRVDVSAPSDYISQALTISPAQFAAELQYLHDKGLRTIGIAELQRDLREQRSVAHDVLLTFDDGYADQFQYAFPILQRYGDVATFFVNVGTIGTPRHMTWDEVETMARAGMSIGCHGVTHVDLSELAASAQSYQIDRCVQLLSAHLHSEVLAYAYPSGAFDAETIALEQQAGLVFGFTTDPRFQTDAQSPYELTRRRIKSGMSAGDFAAIFGTRATYVKLSP
ncbi:MAG: polysaccharide deacetylase family protein [Candidatus Eremiobacteraeota bacterium]|nr:polysaccharide deacetylase family protein [Candidatus Eremiobacteraeota bacterium]MBV8498328.1 polysaccharide deacetylase family protein [Candidatus Eremiobacteraeota bacterium]